MKEQMKQQETDNQLKQLFSIQLDSPLDSIAKQVLTVEEIERGMVANSTDTNDDFDLNKLLSSFEVPPPV